jgi:hypothetical protein
LLERSLIQERNNITDNKADLKPLLQLVLQNRKLRLIFASKFVKQSRTRLFFAKNGTLIASGTGQTSRERFSASRKKKKLLDLIYMALQWQVMLFPSRLCTIGKRSWHYSSNTTRWIIKIKY